MMKADIERTQQQTEDCQKLSTNFQNLEEAKKDPLLQASERTQLCQYFHFKLPASQNLERINFCSLKSLVSFSVPRKLIQVS